MDITESEVSNASAPSLDIISAASASMESLRVDENFLNATRNVHIPYILNGELYVIQSQDGENVTVKCCHCPPDRVYRGSVRSTGNFHMHIKRRHPDLLGKLHDMKVNALLERRERLLKNRKIPMQRSKSIAAISSARSGAMKRENSLIPSSPISFRQPPAPSLMHTHKLKIKQVFQRHQQLQQQQQQQQQQQAMQGWSDTELGLGVVDATPVPLPSPVNYSLRETQNSQAQINYVPLNAQCIQMSHFEQSNAPIYSQHPAVAKANLVAPAGLDNIPTTAPNTPSPCSLSSCASQGNLTGCSHHHIAVVKNEQLLMPEKAIDLSMQSSIGTLSSGIGSIAETLHCDEAGRNGHTVGPSYTSTCNESLNHISDNIMADKRNWQELLVQVESSLRGIQNEMRNRNQIETNRIVLEIAKFKFLHPGFNFHY